MKPHSTGWTASLGVLLALAALLIPHAAHATDPAPSTILKPNHTATPTRMPTLPVKADNLVTVTFDANGGSGAMSAQSASAPSALDPNLFTNPGFFFKGWNTLADGSGTDYANRAVFPFTSATTLYAQWHDRIRTTGPTTVTFVANGGTGSMAPQAAYTATALKPNAFTRAGFTFVRWSTEPNGSGTKFSDGQVHPFVDDETLYAQWTPTADQQQPTTEPPPTTPSSTSQPNPPTTPPAPEPTVSGPPDNGPPTAGPPSAGSPPRSDPGGMLPQTGTSSLTLYTGIVSALLALGGGTLLIVRRQRRQR